MNISQRTFFLLIRWYLTYMQGQLSSTLPTAHRPRLCLKIADHWIISQRKDISLGVQKCVSSKHSLLASTMGDQWTIDSSAPTKEYET